MKKLLLLSIILMLSFIIVGCVAPKGTEVVDTPGISTDMWYKEITIDGCQYLIGGSTAYNNPGYFLTHKGNCSNQIHYHRNKEESPVICKDCNKDTKYQYCYCPHCGADLSVKKTPQGKK